MATKSAELRTQMAADFAATITTGTDGMKLSIFDAGSVLLVEFTGLAFAAGAAGVQSVSGVPITATAVATGTAENATVASDEATPKTITGLTVATSAAQVIIDNTSINSGQDVTLQSFSWTESADVN